MNDSSGVGAFTYSNKARFWDYFGFEANCNKKIISKKAVYCKLCTQRSIQIPYSLNTSNLTYHLSKHHPDIYARVCGASKVGKQDKEKVSKSRNNS